MKLRTSIIVALGIAALTACSYGSSGTPPAGAPGTGSNDGGSDGVAPMIGFAAAESTVFVGDTASLTATFEGDTALIDGIGPVESGVPVETKALSRTTTFTLRVTRGGRESVARTTV